MLKTSRINVAWLQRETEMEECLPWMCMPQVKAAMFAHGTGIIVDIDIWHKRIGHVNVQRLKSMQTKNIVDGLPNFKVDGMHKVCEACQLGK